MKQIFLTILEWILRKLSQITIWRFQPQVIGIAGSVGKTSAKEAIYAVLKNHYQVRKSAGNLNNELGLPLAIITNYSEEELKLVSRSTPAGKKKIKKLIFWIKIIIFALFRALFLNSSFYPKILILEYAADRPNDLEKLLKISQPQIGIITAMGQIPSHVEFFSDPEAVAKEDSKLIKSLPVNGFAIFNFDNETVMKMQKQTQAQVISFGFNNGADLRITNFKNHLKNDKPMGISFNIESDGNSAPVVLKNIFGKAQQSYAAAVAASVGLIFNLNLTEISKALSTNYQQAKGRMNLITGLKDTCIIDDSYNASPLSMQEALNTLQDIPAKRKIAVLGDMLELGKYSIEAHETIGRLAGQIVEILVTVGPLAKSIAKVAKINGLSENKILSFNTTNEACPSVQKLIKKGDLILIKASRGMRLEKIVEAIKEK